MKRSFLYNLHGLTVHSEIQLPELSPLPGGAADIYVQFGTLDTISLPPDRPWGNHILAPDQMLLHIKDVARFLVTNGKSILVDPSPRARGKEIRLFLLGSAMGCLLHQRRLLPMHANALQHGDECIMFMGQSGMGKSTLAAAMKTRGYKVLADDVCAVQTSSGCAPIVYPGVPQIKLWKDAAGYLDADIATMKRVLPDEEKYALPIDDSYGRNPLPIRCMYILDFHDEKELKTADLNLLEKIAAIKRNTYRKGMIAGMGITARHLQMSGELAATTPIRHIFRPHDSLMRIDKLIDAIEVDLS